MTVKGPKGELTQRLPREMIVSLDDAVITVSRPTDSAPHRSLHGLTRTLIANMVQGVTDGFEKRLEIVGVGYRASMKGADLELLVGFSHPAVVTPPPGIEFETPQPQVVVVRGIDKQAVGEVAAQIRRAASARAVQGQGHPLRGRVRRAQGRQARLGAIGPEGTEKA